LTAIAGESFLSRLLTTSARLSGLSETPTLDAQVLLAYVLGKPRAWVLAHPEAELTGEEEAALEAALRRLEAGEPLPYVLGRWEFFGLDLRVSPATLIPRPETELLVELALEWLRKKPRASVAGSDFLLAADVGSGSGCITAALAVHHAGLRILAADVSREALQVARENFHSLGVDERVACVQCDLLPPSGRDFDLVCANLPYIPTDMLKSLRVYGREPNLALDGGPDGLSLVRRLVDVAPGRLAPGGLLLMEIEATQGQAVLALARAAFPIGRVDLVKDLAGHERVVRVEKN
jgi:release factor glutamine methyltransferase